MGWRETEEDTQPWPLTSAPVYAYTHAYTMQAGCLQTLPRVPWGKSHSALRTSQNKPPHPSPPSAPPSEGPVLTIVHCPLPLLWLPMHFISYMPRQSMYLCLFSIAWEWSYCKQNLNITEFHSPLEGKLLFSFISSDFLKCGLPR